MTAVENDLLAALRALEIAVVKPRAASEKPDLLSLFNRVDELAATLPKDAEPTLMHYLQRKSYEKARHFLEGRDSENRAGTCRH